ncbi:hypothetical protein [Halalkalibacter hemicellulosilyticus]|uniref:Uncharacterized protein n=1 Tax=Halalkalibacter hemicellulosilyticusJCM 9152 TaxID=1236971 RepID=W4QDS1_9BACI|nr:hypothetical protein [Halalkalibacter hemicellulosilyticus]GAE30206.1 hypothetical protein JCM9152_1603 [Halalkalibacter hemicellulosilyticusJCM 9152]
MLIDFLQENYNWRDVSYMSNELVKTDKGLKRIRYWEDKQLLKWHISWRDHCSDTPYLLMDRMLRTRNQKPYAEHEDGYITAHDEVVDRYPISGQEPIIANTIVSFIQYGLKTEVNIFPQRVSKCVYDHLDSYIPYLREDQRMDCDFLIREGEMREKKADALMELTDSTPLPYLDPMMSTDQMRSVAKVLYWVGTMEVPVVGYEHVARFFRHWYVEEGEQSCIKLMQGVVDQLEREQLIQILAEMLKPYELNDWQINVEDGTIDRETLEERFQLVKKEWDISKQLVHIMSKMIDKKKVSVT